jgi:hypothetical protein
MNLLQTEADDRISTLMKEFVYLYPIPEYTDFICPPKHTQRRQQYKRVLNQAIDKRYRRQGFNINYVLFDDKEISDVITLKPNDRIIEAGINFSDHITKLPNGEYPYPNPDFILDQLDALKILRVAGFHLADCVEKLAKRAYEREINVLVDEDLTEVLPAILNDPDFKINTYPSFNPHIYGADVFELFMRNRKDKPWLWQDF